MKIKSKIAEKENERIWTKITVWYEVNAKNTTEEVKKIMKWLNRITKAMQDYTSRR